MLPTLSFAGLPLTDLRCYNREMKVPPRRTRDQAIKEAAEIFAYWLNQQREEAPPSEEDGATPSD
jgi:hypothetical protein